MRGAECGVGAVCGCGDAVVGCGGAVGGGRAIQIFAYKKSMPHLLELFCGTKSISKVFEQHGWTCTSLDFDPKTKPSICCNILNVTAEMILQHGRPDVIWASPLCTHYSIARTNAKTPRDLEGSDKLVQKVLDLARYFDVPFFIENPYTGLLKTRDVIQGVPMRVIDYCQYADDDWPGRYRKRTSIWTNTDWYPSRALCIPRTCNLCSDGKKHDTTIRTTPGRKNGKRGLQLLYSIPPALPKELVTWLMTNLEINEE